MVLGRLRNFLQLRALEIVSDLKPDPGMLLRVLEKLKVSPERTMMVGDSTNDVRAAQAIGVRACAVGYGYGNREKVTALNPDFYCEQPTDLFNLLGGS